MAGGEERIHRLGTETQRLRAENARLVAEAEKLNGQRHRVYELLAEALVEIKQHNTVRGMGLLGEAMIELKTVRNP